MHGLLSGSEAIVMACLTQGPVTARKGNMSRTDSTQRFKSESPLSSYDRAMLAIAIVSLLVGAIGAVAAVISLLQWAGVI